MSDTIIVATFDNTNAAYEAASAWKKLKDQKIVDFKPRADSCISSVGHWIDFIRFGSGVDELLLDDLAGVS